MLKGLYYKLLAEIRRIQKDEEAGKNLCKRCGKTRNNHEYDGRCTLYISSGNYVSSSEERLEQLSKFVEWVEEMMEDEICQ